jgi:hypothetical protein
MHPDFTRVGRVEVVIGLQRYVLWCGFDPGWLFWGSARRSDDGRLIIPFSKRFDSPEQVFAYLIGCLEELRGQVPEYGNKEVQISA